MDAHFGKRISDPLATQDRGHIALTYLATRRRSLGLRGIGRGVLFRGRCQVAANVEHGWNGNRQRDEQRRGGERRRDRQNDEQHGRSRDLERRYHLDQRGRRDSDVERRQHEQRRRRDHRRRGGKQRLVDRRRRK